MKLIPLTQGKFAQVDDEDYDYLMQWKWHFTTSKTNRSFYVNRTMITIVNNKRVKKSIKMHRVILGLTDPKIFGDHKDHDGLNNQRNNLRIATQQQNVMNRRSAKDSSSIYLGVSISKIKDNYGIYKYHYWQSSITINKKRISLGIFKKEEDAALAYNEKAKEIFGEFANLNIIN